MKYVVIFAIIILAVVGVVFGTAHLEEESRTDLMFRSINFALFVGILFWLLNKKVATFYAKRRERIAKELEDVKLAKEDAEKRLQDVEAHIANLRAEGEELLAEYRRQGENIQKSIIARAEETARQITDQAQFTIENEAKMAAEGLRFAVADMVVEATEQMLKGQLGKEEHEKLIDKYLNKVVLN